MPQNFANDFFEIPETLANNGSLKEDIISLIRTEPMPAKVLEGNSDRIETFRIILSDLVNGEIGLQEAYALTEQKLPRAESPHASNNRVFASGWAERQIRTQFSRFYNQALLERLRNDQAQLCYIPHSDNEEPSSKCTQLLAGQQQNVDTLYQRLVDAYAQGNWSQDVKIPNHPHCTHVVAPIQ